MCAGSMLMDSKSLRKSPFQGWCVRRFVFGNFLSRPQGRGRDIVLELGDGNEYKNVRTASPKLLSINKANISSSGSKSKSKSTSTSFSSQPISKHTPHLFPPCPLSMPPSDPSVVLFRQLRVVSIRPPPLPLSPMQQLLVTRTSDWPL